jgi:hypothetical protein
MTFEPLLSISSPEPVSGRLPDAWRDGQTIDLFGPPRVPASPSRLPAKGSEPMTQGTCGRTYFASSTPAGPLASWESRLRERLATLGSTESALIWRASATPAGRSKSRLVQSTLHKNGPGTGGSQWRAPTAGDNRGGSYADPEKALARMSSGHTINLEDEMVAAQWCAPTSRDWKDSGGMSLEPRKDGASRIDLLPRQMIHSGPTRTGSLAPTEKRGAPNPVFACWLMGWPDELTFGALQAIALFRKSRRKSSKA